MDAVDARIMGLRRRIERLETAGVALKSGESPQAAALPLGHAEVDAHFSTGGLAWGAHQIAGGKGDPIAAKAFSFMLLARYLAKHSTARALVVQEASVLREGGALHGPGLHALGVNPDRLVLVRTQDGAETLRAVNEALRARVPQILIADLWDGAEAADLSVTRRFNLAAVKARALVLLTTPDLSSTSAALTRWRVASAFVRTPTSSPVERRRLGRPTFTLDLVRNRHGRTGRWILEWNADDLTLQSPGFQKALAPAPALAASMDAAPLHRPSEAGAASAVRSTDLPFGDYRQAS